MSSTYCMLQVEAERAYHQRAAEILDQLQAQVRALKTALVERWCECISASAFFLQNVPSTGKHVELELFKEIIVMLLIGMCRDVTQYLTLKLQMLGERQRGEPNAPLMGGDTYMPPSYDEVRGNGVPRSAPADSDSKPAKSSYFLAEVHLNGYNPLLQQSA